MSSNPRCATCIHWTRGDRNPQRGECTRRCSLGWASTLVDAGWGCPEHEALKVKRPSATRRKSRTRLIQDLRELRKENARLLAELAKARAHTGGQDE